MKIFESANRQHTSQKLKLKDLVVDIKNNTTGLRFEGDLMLYITDDEFIQTVIDKFKRDKSVEMTLTLTH
jgi:hypothetical protein